MKKERSGADCTEQIDVKLQSKEPRLPKSIRIYIRRLKDAGQWNEAIRLGRIKREQKRSRLEMANEELERTLKQVICEDDPLAEASNQIKVVWLLSATGQLTPDERKEEMLRILYAAPQEIQPKLEERLPAIRDEMKPFMPLAV